MAWEEAETFEISLQGWVCSENCKLFALSVDATGHMHVDNPTGAPRLATFDQQIPAQEARTLYRAIVNGGFVELLDRYTADADACEESIDRTVSVLSLSSGAHYKQVVYDRDCAATEPGLVTLLELERQIRKLTTVEQLLTLTAAADCEMEGQPLDFAPVYTIREPDATGVGFLHFTNTSDQRRFIVQGCSGDELTRGTVITEPDCSAQLQLDATSPKLWPGTNNNLTSLFVEGAGVDESNNTLGFLSILFAAEDEVAAQVALPGASCEGFGSSR